MNTRIDKAKAQAAELIGVDAASISSVEMDISMMRELGVMVSLSFHGKSMFHTGATWAEMGVPQDDVRSKRLRRGSKDLIPRPYIQALQSLEVRYRQSLDKHSFPITMGRPFGWRWVPYTAYQAWREEKDELDAELEQWKADVLERYDAFVDALAADFASIAREAWQAIEARRPADAGEWALVTDQGSFESLDVFIDHVVARAMGKMPTRDEIEHGVYAEYSNAVVATGADVQEELLHQDQIRAERNAVRAEQRLEYERERTALEEERQRQRQLRIETQEAEEMADMRLAQAREQMAAMHQAELEHAREQIAQTVSPFQEVVDMFRARINSDVAEIIKSIEKNGHVRGRVAQRAKGLFDVYNLLGKATNDTELESALRDLRDLLNTEPAKGAKNRYDTNATLQELTNIVNLTSEAAQDVAQRARAHTRAGFLEL